MRRHATPHRVRFAPVLMILLVAAVMLVHSLGTQHAARADSDRTAGSHHSLVAATSESPSTSATQAPATFADAEHPHGDTPCGQPLRPGTASAHASACAVAGTTLDTAASWAQLPDLAARPFSPPATGILHRLGVQRT